MPAKIFAPAEARLIEIWDYTLDKWGEEQADAYVRGLVEAMHSLGRNRLRWRKVADKALAGVWVVRHEHHFIFFQELSGGIVGVITVLHESMDLPARIKEACRSEGDDADMWNRLERNQPKTPDQRGKISVIHTCIGTGLAVGVA